MRGVPDTGNSASRGQRAEPLAPPMELQLTEEWPPDTEWAPLGNRVLAHIGQVRV